MVMTNNNVSTPDRLSFPHLEALIGGKLGKFDLPCPVCSPHRRKHREKCFAIWHEEPGFLTFCCAHCERSGYAHRNASSHVDPVRLARLKRDAAVRRDQHRADRSNKARWLWDLSISAISTPRTFVETYLASRHITVRPPATLRVLPPSGSYPPTMIAAFGLPTEPEPGQFSIVGMAVSDVHLTRLLPDGRGKAEVENPKIMVGPASGMPIVLAPVNDTGGLAIAEGIEDALSVHQATGLGAWAAGSANRLPALASVIPSHVSGVTIVVDDDDAGRDGSNELASRLTARGVHVELFTSRSA
jgi:hypothetical protein